MRSSSALLVLVCLALVVVDVNAVKVRRNPLNGKAWEGGFDVANEEYWLSLLTVVIPGFVLAILSFVGFLLYFFVRCCCCKMCGKSCCPQPRKEGYEGFSFVTPLILVLVVGTLSIVGGIVIFAGGAGAVSSLKSFFNELIDLFLEFVEQLSAAVKGMQEAEENFDSNEQGSSEDTQQLLEALQEAKTSVEDNRENVDQGFSVLNSVAMAFGGIIIAFTVVAFVAVLCRMQWMLNIPIFFIWILLFFTWSLFGFGVLFETVFSDLCTEMEVYQNNPADSTLTKFIPCPETNPDEDPVLFFQIYSNDVIIDLNQKFKDANSTTATTGMVVNELVCPPYIYLNGDYEVTPAPSQYCQDTNTTYQVTIEDFGTTTAFDDVYCTQDEDPCLPWKITYQEWQDIREGVAALVVVKGLLPVIDDVLNCEFINTVVETLLSNCKPITSSLKTFYVGFAVASSGMIASMVLWLAFYPRFKGGKGASAKLDFSYSHFKQTS